MTDWNRADLEKHVIDKGIKSSQPNLADAGPDKMVGLTSMTPINSNPRAPGGSRKGAVPSSARSGAAAGSYWKRP